MLQRMFSSSETIPHPTLTRPQSDQDVIQRMFHAEASTSLQPSPAVEPISVQKGEPVRVTQDRQTDVMNRMFSAAVERGAEHRVETRLQELISELVSISTSIRDHNVKLKALRKLKKERELEMHQILKELDQDGVQSSDHPVVFYTSTRVSRKANKNAVNSKGFVEFWEKYFPTVPLPEEAVRKKFFEMFKSVSQTKTPTHSIRSVAIKPGKARE